MLLIRFNIVSNNTPDVSTSANRKFPQWSRLSTYRGLHEPEGKVELRRSVAQSVKQSPLAKVVGLPRRKMAATSEEPSVMEPSQTNSGQSQSIDPLKMLYPMVNEEETPLPRSWSPKDKYNYIGLSQNNLRVHYKGTFLISILYISQRLFILPPREFSRTIFNIARNEGSRNDPGQ